MPYLNHIKTLSSAWPHLRYLAQWMQVTTSPIKWQFIGNKPETDDIRKERASRIKVAAVDFVAGQSPPGIDEITSHAKLSECLGSPMPPGTSRLYIVEDLSRDVIELLGSKLDIDPLFFREQISDYFWYNTRDPWVELPDLEVVTRNRPFFRIAYLQPRYFKNEKDFIAAKRQAGMFNVLRRLDDDNHGSLFDENGATVALVRCRASLWIKPGTGEDRVGVLLIDPPITQGIPLWGGYRPFVPSPTPSQSQRTYEEPPRDKLYDDLLFWIRKMAQRDIDAARDNPLVMAHRMFQIVCAEWLTLNRYILARLGQIEWEVERPDFRLEATRGIDSSLSKSHTWRRRLPVYRSLIADAKEKLFRRRYYAGPDSDLNADPDPDPDRARPPRPRDAVADLRDDFDVIERQIEGLLRQTERITAVTTAVAAFEESRRAVEQNRALGRLTYLAVIFAPLSFVSSFFSMSDNVSALSQTYWVYFCVAVPISLAVYLVVDKNWTDSFKGLKNTVRHPHHHHHDGGGGGASGGGSGSGGSGGGGRGGHASSASSSSFSSSFFKKY
ncbi:hypothetical protein F5X99DRAFT_377669 [Biscogniauxia marginata]|nr:hypothetical protein F5X99DRAFT_377669 [Biscogniauxia marginata]